MRRSTAHNQRLDRQRLSFATCRKCGRRVAVLAIEGQDPGLILYQNGFRLPSAIALEIAMECMSCYEIRPLSGGELREELRKHYDALLEWYARERERERADYFWRY